MLPVIQFMPGKRILKSNQGHGRLSHKIKSSFKIIIYPQIRRVWGEEMARGEAMQEEKLLGALKNSFVNVWVRVLMELELKTLP